MLKRVLKYLGVMVAMLVLFAMGMYFSTTPKVVVPATVADDASLPAIEVGGVRPARIAVQIAPIGVRCIDHDQVVHSQQRHAVGLRQIDPDLARILCPPVYAGVPDFLR